MYGKGQLKRPPSALELLEKRLGAPLLSRPMLIELALSLPALLAGSALGLLAFRVVNEAMFRRVILVILLVSGGLLVS